MGKPATDAPVLTFNRAVETDGNAQPPFCKKTVKHMKNP